MTTRRRFLKMMLAITATVRMFFGATPVRGETTMPPKEKTLLPKETDATSLGNKNPAELDTSRLEITPLDRFGTMGLEDHETDAAKWRLLVDGAVNKPLKLTYAQMKEMRTVEREVLLVCPGFFSQHGRWRGISIGDLLTMAEVQPEATHVTISGPEIEYPKSATYPIAETRSEKVFLAHSVNGVDLPMKHGFPLRLVAEGYHANDWVKYVYRITATKG